MGTVNVELIERVCHERHFPLVVKREQPNHGWFVLHCCLTNLQARVPRTLERDLRDVLAAKSRVYVIRRGDVVEIAIPREPPLAVDFRACVSTLPADGIPFVAGMNMHDEVRFADFSKVPHALIAGDTGCGKSSLVTSLLHSLQRVGPDRIKIAAIDIAKPKSIEQIPADLLWDAADRAATAYHMVRKVVDEQNDRLRNPGHTFDLVVLIDEVAALLDQVPEIGDGLVNLAKVAREAGIHLVLVSQSPDDIPKHALKELHCRAIFRLSSKPTSKREFGNDSATELRTGELFFRGNSTDTFELLRAPRVH